jgi:predicted metal-dependent hydrolase
MTSSPGRGRDRDEDGRARNARPRDRLGRPLPSGSIGIDRVPEDLDLPPEKTLSWAQDLLNQGYAFTAHEVLEGAWKSGPTDERMLWQGLAQLAVAITHIQRRNPTGAVALLKRAIVRIGHSTGPAPHGIDKNGLTHHAEELIELLQRNIEPTPDQLAPRLTRKHRASAR